MSCERVVSFSPRIILLSALRNLPYEPIPVFQAPPGTIVEHASTPQQVRAAQESITALQPDASPRPGEAWRLSERRAICISEWWPDADHLQWEHP